MDKSRDVFVLFYHPSDAFCAGNATAFGQFVTALEQAHPTVLGTHMDVAAHKSPFVFEEDELPVVMLFPAQVRSLPRPSRRGHAPSPHACLPAPLSWPWHLDSTARRL